MFGSSGTGASARPTRRLPERRARRDVAVRSALLASAVFAYGASFKALHGHFGNPAFLVGLVLCLVAGAWLGVRGALAVIVTVALLDRHFALGLPRTPELGTTAAVISLLVKLVLAGGLGLVVDSRRRVLGLNAELRREIEARERSEQAVRHSEGMRRALIDSLGEGVGLFDKHDRVVFANQALAETLGTAADALESRAFFEFLTEESRTVLAAAKPNVAGRRSYEVVLEANPSTLLLVTETRFEPDGSHDELTLRVIRDLTERVVTERRQRDLERELQRSQALQSLAVMAGGVAHDFNNLLSGVLGNAEVALLKVPGNAPPQLTRGLTEIITFAREAAQLSKQMLAYAGRRSLAIQALELNLELTAALRLLHATVEARARLVLEAADGLPAVGADPFQLRQVMTNLILNALDAMEGERGTLTLRTEAVRLDAPNNERYGVGAGNYVKVTVSDTGSGIDPEARERLFEPFFSTKGTGRGMGLAAAAGIVRAHRGWLGVEETSREGTRFGVLLPVAQASLPRRPSRPIAASEPPPPTRSILLIDDEPAVRLVTGRMLTELGHRVVTADSGRRGLELFEQRPHAVDLVVLDLTMPEQSGEQTLASLRDVRDDVPVAITSGFQAEDASLLLEMPNVIGFLEKPHTLMGLEMLLASLARPATGNDSPSRPQSERQRSWSAGRTVPNS